MFEDCAAMRRSVLGSRESGTGRGAERFASVSSMINTTGSALSPADRSGAPLFVDRECEGLVVVLGDVPGPLHERQWLMLHRPRDQTLACDISFEPRTTPSKARSPRNGRGTRLRPRLTTARLQSRDGKLALWTERYNSLHPREALRYQPRRRAVQAGTVKSAAP